MLFLAPLELEQKKKVLVWQEHPEYCSWTINLSDEAKSSFEASVVGTPDERAKTRETPSAVSSRRRSSTALTPTPNRSSTRSIAPRQVCCGSVFLKKTAGHSVRRRVTETRERLPRKEEKTDRGGSYRGAGASRAARSHQTPPRAGAPRDANWRPRARLAY